mmetsp:Transcript_79508/g.157524  ORF Transcript_79508/g.157524 Transcript_79508/m.157524 type:complete len:180 (-) Transcript_79508:108-647(-)
MRCAVHPQAVTTQAAVTGMVPGPPTRPAQAPGGFPRPVEAWPEQPRQVGSKQPVRRTVFNAQDIEDHFPTFYTEGGTTCAICLSVIDKSDLCRKTSCGHTFHAECIMKWWTREMGKVLCCPVCRKHQRIRVNKARWASNNNCRGLPNQSCTRQEPRRSIWGLFPASRLLPVPFRVGRGH